MTSRLALDDLRVVACYPNGHKVRARCLIPSGTELGFWSADNETRYLRVDGERANLLAERDPESGGILLRAAEDIQAGVEVVMAQVPQPPAAVAPARPVKKRERLEPEEDEEEYEQEGQDEPAVVEGSFHAQFWSLAANLKRIAPEHCEQVKASKRGDVIRALQAIVYDSAVQAGESEDEALKLSSAGVSMKKCCRCKKWKPEIVDFYFHKGQQCYYGKCKSCHNVK